jgi:hypothetical protein
MEIIFMPDAEDDLTFLVLSGIKAKDGRSL